MSAGNSWGFDGFRSNRSRSAGKLHAKNWYATLRVEALEERQMLSAVSPVAGWWQLRPATITPDSYEADNSFATAKTITLNAAAQTHNIHVRGDADFVKFTLTTSTSVVLTTAGSAGDTELRLYNSSYRQLAYNNDSGGTFSQISTTLAAGTYYARVNEYGNNATISAYTLQLTGTTVTTTTNYMLCTNWGGTWTDVDKSTTNTDDDLLCWAATTSNMLQWTGWGNTAGLTSADAIFTYFQNHWSDQGGHVYYGTDWWFDGTNNMQGVSGWAQVEVAGGGFYPAQNLSNYIHYSSALSSTMSTVSSYLRSGYIVGLGLSGPGGHAITCWGYEFTAGNTSSFKGVYVTDSDDNQSAPGSDYLKYYSVVQSAGRWYLQNYYGSNSWYISDVTGLASRPAGVTSTSMAAAAAYTQATRATWYRFTDATDTTMVDHARSVEDHSAVEQLLDNADREAMAQVEADATDAVVTAADPHAAQLSPQWGDRSRGGDAIHDRAEQAVALLQDAPTQLQLLASDAVFQAYL